MSTSFQSLNRPNFPQQQPIAPPRRPSPPRPQPISPPSRPNPQIPNRPQPIAPPSIILPPNQLPQRPNFPNQSVIEHPDYLRCPWVDRQGQVVYFPYHLTCDHVISMKLYSSNLLISFIIVLSVRQWKSSIVGEFYILTGVDSFQSYFYFFRLRCPHGHAWDLRTNHCDRSENVICATPRRPLS